MAYCAAVASGIYTTKAGVTNISIYPNPANSTLNIDLENNVSGELILSFFDLYGREVKQMTLEKANSSLDIKDIGQGMYLLKISDRNNRTLYQGKLLKD